MADEEKRITYVIRVISDDIKHTSYEGEASTKADTVSGKSKKAIPETKERSVSSPDSLKSLTRMASVGYAARMAGNFINNEINRVELRTGNAVLQQKIQYATSVATRATATVGALVAGALSGNPLLIVGAATSAIELGIINAQRQATMALQNQLESVGIGMANIRAGANGSRGRKDQI